MKKFRGEDDGCVYCDFRPYAVKDHFCQRGRHMNYAKCGWYTLPTDPQYVEVKNKTTHNK